MESKATGGRRTPWEDDVMMAPGVARRARGFTTTAGTGTGVAGSMARPMDDGGPPRTLPPRRGGCVIVTASGGTASTKGALAAGAHAWPSKDNGGLPSTTLSHRRGGWAIGTTSGGTASTEGARTAANAYRRDGTGNRPGMSGWCLCEPCCFDGPPGLLQMPSRSTSRSEREDGRRSGVRGRLRFPISG